MNRIESLDGVRGLAVLIVLLGHLSGLGLVWHPAFDFSGFGKVGVFLFFVLSAFLLSSQLLGRPREQLGQPWLWARYFERRILRIFPLYAMALVAVAWWAGYQQNYVIRLGWDEILPHLLLQQGKEVFWAIPVEFAYYLVLPLVVILLQKPLKGHAFAGGMAVTAGVVLAGLWWPAQEAVANDIRLGPYLPVFLLGTLAALLHVRLQQAPLWGGRWQMFMEVVAWGCFLSMFLTVPHWWGLLATGPVQPTHFHDAFLMYGLLLSLGLLAMLNGRGWLRKVFELPPLRWLGHISFSLYLVHLPVILWVKKQALTQPSLQDSVPMQVGLALLLTLGISLLTYWLIERPFLAIRLVDRLQVEREKRVSSMA